MVLCHLLMFLVAFGLAVLPAPAQSTKAPAKGLPKPKVLPAEEIRWGESREAAPSDAKVAILYGDPDAQEGGPFVIRVKASDGASVGPQWHGSDLHLTVLQGSLVFCEGSSFDEQKAQTLGPGSYILVPRRVRYILQVRGESEYQIQGNGPLRTFIVKPAPPPAVVTTSAVSPEEQQQKAEFDAAMDAYNRAYRSRDQSALQGPVKKEFERIARGAGRYAGQAQQFLSANFLAELRAPGTCPAIPVLRDPGWLVQELKPGDVVATGLLDPKLTWLNCPSPSFPQSTRATSRSGVIRLAVTLDENGNVTNVKARGGFYPPGFLEAATEAVRQWKTNPPRVKSIPVRTEISVDLPFSD